MSLSVFAVAVNCLGNAQCETGLPKVDANNANLQQILQIVFGVIGVVAVIVIMWAGLKFITAQGNPQEAAKARMTIIYAVIGLILAISAEVIVTFVLNNI
jgi:hypothetical protein